MDEVSTYFTHINSGDLVSHTPSDSSQSDQFIFWYKNIIASNNIQSISPIKSNVIPRNYKAVGKVIYLDDNLPDLSAGGLIEYETLNHAANLVFSGKTNFELESRSSVMPDNNDIMKYIDHLDKDRRDMELRLSDDRKESENRLNKTIEKLETKMDSLDNKFDKTIEKIETKVDSLDNKFEAFTGNVDSKLSEQRKWLIGILIAVVGIIITLGIGFTQIILSILKP